MQICSALLFSLVECAQPRATFSIPRSSNSPVLAYTLKMCRRIKSMVNQKQSLASERRKAAAQSRLQKESLMKVMEELKTNATKANKIITKAMTSDVPLTELIMPKRSNSASKKMKSSKTTSELLGLGRESRSGGVNGTGDMSSSVAGFSVSGDGPPPKPYVSPYLSTDQGGDAWPLVWPGHLPILRQQSLLFHPSVCTVRYTLFLVCACRHVLALLCTESFPAAVKTTRACCLSECVELPFPA